MLKGKCFWYLMMAGSIGGWIFAITGLVRPFENPALKKTWKGVLCTWAGGHPLELALALKIGRTAGLSTCRTVVKTMAFGFTWWLPLKLGLISR